MAKTLTELTDNDAIRQRAKTWKQDPTKIDPERLLKDIEAIGKARFAQRLVTHMKSKTCPSYIEKAIHYVAEQCD